MSAAKIFLKQSGEVTRDLRQRELVHAAMDKYGVARTQAEHRFQDWEAARETAADIKDDAIQHLDRYLGEFANKLEARGTIVHWAGSGADAREIILKIARDRKARSIIKSKAMTCEEIHLNTALEEAGFRVIESDLGEFIVQLRREPAFHIVFPAMHLTRRDIGELFVRKLGCEPAENPEELTMIARRVLRKEYMAADIGITGANFAIAETGMISITENEGNARLTAALPPVMITVLGIEKILPRLEDLALFLPLLAGAGTGQPLTCYNSLYGGPRQPDEPDGPEEFHVVLLDNHRTSLLADIEQREALRCIRCGACLNACPVFRNIGGPAYGTTYSGPIGSVITPHLRGLHDWKHLSSASSLCGACTATCPVKIDLHHHLLRNRRNAVAQNPGLLERQAFRLFAFVVNRPALYGLATRVARAFQPLHRRIQGTLIDPARPWTQSRELQPIAAQTFKEWWRQRP